MIKKILIIAFLISYTINAQKINKAKLDSLFSVIDHKNKGMGSVSVLENGIEIYQHTMGYADLKNKVKASHNTKYRIGSITKTFTATIIMQLIEEKKLSLGTFLSDYFPKIPNADKITIKHLLKHRSGLYNITNDKDFRKWMVVPNTRQQMLDRIEKKEIQFKPDEKGKYSNTNYVLLSYIAEDIEEKSYAEILKSRIITPCHLKNTYYGSKINSKENEALSYHMDEEWMLQPETDMSVPIGAGAIVSTSKDVAIFYHNLFSDKLVSKESLLKMKDLEDSYGMGLVQFPYDHKENFGHSGGIDGFQSVAIYVPEDKLSISYLSNGVILGLTEILVGVANIYYDLEYKLPEFKPALQLKTEELDAYLGVYIGEEFPFEITMTKEDTTLIVSAKKGPTFPVESHAKNKFQSNRAGVHIEFFPEQNKMILQLGGKKAEFIRK
ncbi:serine hydrolase domain-containing protein [Aquimarina algiphila]|uniref:serine hydrolase domain-containing protein n=1 Tax=Aquimarina algiphila TaxID=2047982 RepID=UPI0023304456|nr:serine hydrolase domain-containing protein [Aquimarina algiphila]